MVLGSNLPLVFIEPGLGGTQDVEIDVDENLLVLGSRLLHVTRRHDQTPDSFHRLGVSATGLQPVDGDLRTPWLVARTAGFIDDVVEPDRELHFIREVAESPKRVEEQEASGDGSRGVVMAVLFAIRRV